MKMDMSKLVVIDSIPLFTSMSLGNLSLVLTPF